MSEVLLELAFYGKLVEGVDQVKAKQNMAQLFKAGPEQIEKMFSGQRVVIRNKLDKETAGKYVAVLRKNGVIVSAEIMGREAPAPQTTASVQPTSSSAPVTGPATAPAPSVTAAGGEQDTGADKRLHVAGERTDAVLAGKNFTVAPVGERLSEAHEVDVPVFEHLDEISLAPVGSRMSDEDKGPPPVVPDISGLSVAPVGTKLSD